MNNINFAAVINRIRILRSVGAPDESVYDALVNAAGFDPGAAHLLMRAQEVLDRETSDEVG